MKNKIKIISVVLLNLTIQYIFSAPYGATFYDTSEYMMGRIAVGIIFPESDGSIDPNTEDWTSEMKNMVITEITSAMDWWAKRDTRANLSFVYVITTVATSYEPIYRPARDQSLWINEIMEKMGYKDAHYLNRVRHYCNDLRKKHNTDWAFVIFVVNSLNDPDGKFADGRLFAYAYLGGPFHVMTYDNAGFGISNMDVVCAHETGHTFYALDEYAGASSVNERSGYLNIQNGNHKIGGITDVPCIMRGGRETIDAYITGSVCTYTRQMVGWGDTDGDNIFDILDVPPEGVIYPYSPDPTNNNTPKYVGKAKVFTYPNQNPRRPWPSTTNSDITINTIKDVKYRINGGEWLSAVAADGKFDQFMESFTFTTAALPDGRYTIEVMAIDSAGNSDPAPATDTLTIDTTSPTASIAISPAPPLKTGEFRITLIITDATDIPKKPRLDCVLPDGSTVSISLKGSNKDWSGSIFIESTTPEGIARFKFTAVDSAGNIGTKITTGETFEIDTTVNVALDGTVSNSDKTTINVPSGAHSKNINIRIITPDPDLSKIKEADSSLIDDKAIRQIRTINLHREIMVTCDESGEKIRIFDKPLTISIPYPDNDQNGIVDGTNIKEQNLKMFYLDENQKKWVLIPDSNVDTIGNNVKANVSHLSIFKVMLFILPVDLSGVFGYPNPCYVRTDGYVRIANIPLDAKDVKIYIYNIAGELVRILEEPDEIETRVTTKVGKWDGRNENDKIVASGVYIYLIKSSNKKPKTEKIAIFW